MQSQVVAAYILAFSKEEVLHVRPVLYVVADSPGRPSLSGQNDSWLGQQCRAGQSTSYCKLQSLCSILTICLAFAIRAQYALMRPVYGALNLELVSLRL